MVLDAGALVALDRRRRDVWALLAAALADDEEILVLAPVVAQVWRDGARQANLSRALAGCEEVAYGPTLGRTAGRLLAAAGTADVVDAGVAVLAAERAAVVVTSDPDDLHRLRRAGAAALSVLAV